MLCLCLSLALVSVAKAADGRILKVLPQFLDDEGRNALTPSLYDRDAYQAFLRRNPTKRSALRFAVEWKASTPKTETLKLRVEMRGVPGNDLAKETSLEMFVHQQHWLGNWAYLALEKDAYKKFGEVTAWRVTLWDGDQLLSEQKSFLW
jgi:hypothetical protein